MESDLALPAWLGPGQEHHGLPTHSGNGYLVSPEHEYYIIQISQSTAALQVRVVSSCSLSVPLAACTLVTLPKSECLWGPVGGSDHSCSGVLTSPGELCSVILKVTGLFHIFQWEEPTESGSGAAQVGK